MLMNKVTEWLKPVLDKQATDVTGWWKVGTLISPSHLKTTISHEPCHHSGCCHWILNTEAKVWPQGSSCGIYGAKVTLGQILLQTLQFVLFHSTNVASSFIIWGWYSGPFLWPQNQGTHCHPTHRINYRFHVIIIVPHLWMLYKSCVTQKNYTYELHEQVSACFLLLECRIKS
jgi:hypothetical protein